MAFKRVRVGRGHPPTEGFHERLREVVEALGGPEKASDIAGIPRTSLYKWMSGKARPPLLAVAALCEDAGKSVDWLVGLLPAAGGDFAYVPRLDVEASAGAGAVTIEEDIGGMLAFRSDWLRRVGVPAQFARVLTARGDSMEPTIRDGDALLVHVGIDRIVDEGIYVVVVAGMVVVKRLLRRRDGTVILRSDNRERYDDEVVPPADVPDLRVAGRVCWFGRSI